MRCSNEGVTWASEQQVFRAGYEIAGLKEQIEALVYIRESEIHRLARVMVPYTGED